MSGSKVPEPRWRSRRDVDSDPALVSQLLGRFRSGNRRRQELQESEDQRARVRDQGRENTVVGVPAEGAVVAPGADVDVAAGSVDGGASDQGHAGMF